MFHNSVKNTLDDLFFGDFVSIERHSSNFPKDCLAWQRDSYQFKGLQAGNLLTPFAIYVDTIVNNCVNSCGALI